MEIKIISKLNNKKNSICSWYIVDKKILQEIYYKNHYAVLNRDFCKKDNNEKSKKFKKDYWLVFDKKTKKQVGVCSFSNTDMAIFTLLLAKSKNRELILDIIRKLK